MARKKAPIQELDPKLIKPDPENVRHQNEDEIEADESFQRLKESVYTYGVLVPLVVKNYNKRGDNYEYILVDGERRLRAALATNISKVPTHIIEGKLADQMLYAFQIHMLRKEWSRTAQARALLKIVNDIKKEKKIVAEKKIFPILQERTGYNQNKLKDLLRVLRYAGKHPQIFDDLDNSKNNLKFSHLVQLEASFVEQLEKNFPDIVKEYGIRKIRELLVKKVTQEIITATREPIEQLLPLFVHAKKAEQKKYLKILIKKFLDNPSKTPEEICRTYELKFPSNKEDLIKSVKQACHKMEDLESILNNLSTRQLRIYRSLGRNIKKQMESLTGAMQRIRRSLK